MKNKKAESRVLSIWMFLNWVVILLFVTFVIYMLFSTSIDTRRLEAEALLEKTSSCVVQNGKLILPVQGEQRKAELIKQCSFSHNIDTGGFYAGVFVYDYSAYRNKDIKNQLDSIELGNLDFKIQCEIKGKNFASCQNKFLLARNPNLNLEYVVVEIVAGSNNRGERA